jgi:hypothetical protein
MRSLTIFQWLGTAITTQLVVAAGVTGFGLDPSNSSSTAKVLGVSTARESKDNGADKKAILASGTVPGLYPGATLELPVLLENRNNFDVVVVELAASVAHASSSCRAGNVEIDDFTGRRLVPENGTAVQTMVVRMHHDAPDACKSVEWQVTYSGRAEKDKP